MNADAIVWILVIIALVVIAVIVWLALRKRRTAALRDRFGEEYDRTVQVKGTRSAAEIELEQREHRVSQLKIRPLTTGEVDRFTEEWLDVKRVFVDSPVEAVHHADRFLAEIMRTRGYPMADFELRYADLTVDHPDVARYYREGHEITERYGRGEATTEDMRQAMLRFEALFTELVSDVAGQPSPGDKWAIRPSERPA